MPTNWTKQQSEVIRSRVGSTVVIAAPGSGKTSVLTEHIVKAVHHDGISPEHIMAVTFTRQAALHMRHKLKQHPAMSFRSSETLRIGTFHARMFQDALYH
ncbi:UvrD-helicase domain-containing protein [Alicyclobacillus dauci]|uniref:UvrD-helicase domain-containing protein n=1 Tax=Alicyclobacillus dauci TaxID=1475485 RepID=A0ABY6YWY8_9BACL|nr:UvrD-helicase domain-containing protein [Alicyclobacillus dauci]WAH34997.1 UvrD-helicase domain-containing protein [Alicyclobacillus dauci]